MIPSAAEQGFLLITIFSRENNLFSFLYILKWYGLNYIAICLYKVPNVISHSNRLVVYLLPTVMSFVIGNHRFVDGFVLPEEREL